MENKKLLAIDLLTNTDKSTKEIADELNISRTTLWTWRTRDIEFMRLLNEKMENQKKYLSSKFVDNADQVTDRLLEIILDPNTKDSDVISASKFWVEHSIGKSISKLDITADQRVEHNISDKDILDLFEED